MNSEQIERLLELIESIDKRLANIEERFEEPKISSSSIDILTKIPKSHRKTYFAVKKLGKVTCTEVAEETGRSHNLESRYLVKLHETFGVLERERVPISDPDKSGTEVKYYIKEEII